MPIVASVLLAAATAGQAAAGGGPQPGNPRPAVAGQLPPDVWPMPIEIDKAVETGDYTPVTVPVRASIARCTALNGAESPRCFSLLVAATVADNRTNDFAASLAWARRLAGIADRWLAADSPDRVLAYDLLGTALERMGLDGEALAARRVAWVASGGMADPGKALPLAALLAASLRANSLLIEEEAIRRLILAERERKPGEVVPLATALGALAANLGMQGRQVESTDLYRRAAMLLQRAQLADRKPLVETLSNYGQALWTEGSAEEAVLVLNEAVRLAVASASADLIAQAGARLFWSMAQLTDGDPNRRAHVEQKLRQFAATYGERSDVALEHRIVIYAALGRLHKDAARLTEAEAAYARASELAREYDGEFGCSYLQIEIFHLQSLRALSRIDEAEAGLAAAGRRRCSDQSMIDLWYERGEIARLHRRDFAQARTLFRRAATSHHRKAVEPAQTVERAPPLLFDRQVKVAWQLANDRSGSD